MCAGYWRNWASGSTTAMLRLSGSCVPIPVCRLAYSAEGVLQKPVLAQFLLASEANKQAVNDVVHPAVARDFEQSSYEWMECAILFDSGFHRRIHLDFVVCVTAPVPVRIQRIMQRDHISAAKAQQWIDAVMPQEELAARSDFEIVNDGVQDIEAQVRRLLNIINNKE